MESKWMFILLAVMRLGAAVKVDKSLFGAKTAYDWVHVPRQISSNVDTFVQYQGRNCRAIHVNTVLRHGYRLPGSLEVEEITELAAKLRENKQSNGVLDFLDGWQLELDGSPGLLNALGRQEMADIGSRTTRRFEQLLSNAENRIELISTDMNRTIESGINFAHGLFNHGVTDASTVSVNETLLRIYESCSHYKTVIASEDIKGKKEAFASSYLFLDLLRRMEGKLGFDNHTHLTKNEVKRMWEFCALDMLNDVEDQWCSTMDNQDRKILEYVFDLESYFDYSYGNGVSGDIHCVVLKKLFKLMDDAKAGHVTGSKDYTVGSFMFGHTGTLLGTLTALGLYHDKPSINGNTMNQGRLFKISKIAPMSGNVGFAMYACEDTTKSVNKTQYAVKLFFNELEMEIPQFNSPIHWYDDVKQMFVSALSCDVNSLCEDRGSPSRASREIDKAQTLILLTALFAVNMIWFIQCSLF